MKHAESCLQVSRVALVVSVLNAIGVDKTEEEGNHEELNRGIKPSSQLCRAVLSDIEFLGQAIWWR